MATGVFVEMYLSSAWRDISGDVLMSVPLRATRGIQGHSPSDRVASVGTMSFALINLASNSGSAGGYYSPTHANARADFTHGAKVRVKLSSDDPSVSRCIWNGRVKTIHPEPGSTGSGRTFVTATDIMDRLGRIEALALPLLTGVTADAAVQDLIDQLTDAPENTSLSTGSDTLPIVFDDLGGSTPASLEVLNDLCQTELGYFYVRGDAADGETVTWVNRAARATATSSLTLTEGNLRFGDGIEVPSDLSQIYNDVQLTTYPRRVGTSNVVLISADREIGPVDAGGGVQVLHFDYRDPSEEAIWVGGKTMVTMASTTDWTANATSGGGGTDLTASFTVVATYYGSTAKVTITNNHATSAGYVRGPSGAAGFQARGLMLSRYSPVVTKKTNSASITANDNRVLAMDMPYQADEQGALGAATFLADSLSSTSNVPTRVRLNTEVHALFASALQRDVGDLVTVSEAVTGVSSQEAFINAWEIEVVNGRVGTWWTLAPGNAGNDFFIFGTSKFGTGRFGF